MRAGRSRVGATLTALTAALALAAPASVASGPAVPIPDDPRGALLQPFLGGPSTEPPLHRAPVPQHPYMAANDASIIHNDAYQTDAYRPARARSVADLAGQQHAVQRPSDCSSLTFDSPTARIAHRLRLRRTAPRWSRIIRSTTRSRRSRPTSCPSASPAPSPSTTSSGSGGYFYLDDRRPRSSCRPPTSRVLVVKRRAGDALTLVDRSYDLERGAPAAPASSRAAARLVRAGSGSSPRTGVGRLRRPATVGVRHPGAARGRGDRQQLRDRRVRRGLRRLRPTRSTASTHVDGRPRGRPGARPTTAAAREKPEPGLAGQRHHADAHRARRLARRAARSRSPTTPTRG